MLADRADVGFSALRHDSHSEASLALNGAADHFVGVNKMVHGLSFPLPDSTRSRPRASRASSRT